MRYNQVVAKGMLTIVTEFGGIAVLTVKDNKDFNAYVFKECLFDLNQKTPLIQQLDTKKAKHRSWGATPPDPAEVIADLLFDLSVDDSPYIYDSELFTDLLVRLLQVDDLLDAPALIPANIAEVFATFDACTGNTYTECERILKLVEVLGYTFDFGLEGSPYNLRKL